MNLTFNPVEHLTAIKVLGYGLILISIMLFAAFGLLLQRVLGVHVDADEPQ